MKIKVNDRYCIGGYCSPNVNIEQFNAYLHELDYMIRINKRDLPTMIIAGDFCGNATALKPIVREHTCWIC